MRTIYADDLSGAWKSSVNKWVKAVKLAESGELNFYDLNNPCGFCRKYNNVWSKNTCFDCPLEGDYCSNYFSDKTVFGQLRYATNIDGRAEVLCRGMLNEILCNEF